jgi:hypothetical protein
MIERFASWPPAIKAVVLVGFIAIAGYIVWFWVLPPAVVFLNHVIAWCIIVPAFIYAIAALRILFGALTVVGAGSCLYRYVGAGSYRYDSLSEKLKTLGAWIFFYGGALLYWFWKDAGVFWISGMLNEERGRYFVVELFYILLISVVLPLSGVILPIFIWRDRRAWRAR